MSDLSDLLRDAVPEPPDLVGLAREAERRARRTRQRRCFGSTVALAAAVVVVAAGAVVLPRHSDGAAPAGGVDASCRVTTGSKHHGALAYVRFCPVSQRGAALVPSVPLTTDLSSVGSVVADVGRTCLLVVAGPYRIVAGYGDGSVHDVGSCQSDYDTLMRAIAAQQQALLTTPPPTLPTPILTPMSQCPPEDAEIASTLQGSPLLSLPVAYAYRCDDDSASFGDSTATGLSQATGELIRLQVLGQADLEHGGDCRAEFSATSIDYVLVLADGSTHTVVTQAGACALTVDGVGLGVPESQFFSMHG